jgi:hypothetical protein
MLVKPDLTSQIQATGVDATAYGAKLPGGETAVAILNKDAERDLELTLDFGASRGGAVETETLRAHLRWTRAKRTSLARRSGPSSSRAGRNHGAACLRVAGDSAVAFLRG